MAASTVSYTFDFTTAGHNHAAVLGLLADAVNTYHGLGTTVTTGASSATQTVGSTVGMQVGQTIYFVTAGATRTVRSITNATTVVLTSTISTTTGEYVAIDAAHFEVEREGTERLGTGVTIGQKHYSVSLPVTRSVASNGSGSLMVGSYRGVVLACRLSPYCAAISTTINGGTRQLSATANVQITVASTAGMVPGMQLFAKTDNVYLNVMSVDSETKVTVGPDPAATELTDTQVITTNVFNRFIPFAVLEKITALTLDTINVELDS